MSTFTRERACAHACAHPHARTLSLSSASQTGQGARRLAGPNRRHRPLAARGLVARNAAPNLPSMEGREAGHSRNRWCYVSAAAPQRGQPAARKSGGSNPAKSNATPDRAAAFGSTPPSPWAHASSCHRTPQAASPRAAATKGPTARGERPALATTSANHFGAAGRAHGNSAMQAAAWAPQGTPRPQYKASGAARKRARRVARSPTARTCLKSAAGHMAPAPKATRTQVAHTVARHSAGHATRCRQHDITSASKSVAAGHPGASPRAGSRPPARPHRRAGGKLKPPTLDATRRKATTLREACGRTTSTTRLRRRRRTRSPPGPSRAQTHALP